MSNNVIHVNFRPEPEPEINPWLSSEEVHTEHVPPPIEVSEPGPEIPECILQYRADLETESQASGPGWGTAILAGLGLNLLF